jgi:hypothetical protein
MRNLSQKIILAVLLSVSAFAQSPHGNDFDIDCGLCHVAESWKVDLKKVQFDHKSTNFELMGQHKAIDCRSCHVTLEFSKVKSDCISCHTDLHQGTVGKDCAKCHTPKSWMVEDINGLHQKSRFPLVGNHLIADCQQCHPRYVDLYFEPLNIDCYACHLTDYNSTQNPNHASAGFSTQCQDCHDLSSSSWATVNVVHDFFPLVGGHAISDCFQCHQQGGNFSGLSPDCITCHQDDYNSVQDPNHIAGNFPTNCTVCHTIYGWSPANFDHNATTFPLTGKHVTVDCQECHSTGYSGTPTDCYACHREDYETTNDPNHVARGYSTVCTDCHNTNDWDDIGNFDHNITLFTLTGSHITTDCIECHQESYSNTPMQCVGCHQDDFNTAEDPNHVTSNFPTECAVCHSTIAWEPAQFDHNITLFPLTGAHITTDCINCHEQGYTNTPAQCFACHAEDFNTAQDPNHVTSNFPTECAVCHSTTAWEPATFDHNLTLFPLTGQHITVDCQDCHESGYTGTPTDCYTCHQQDFEGVQDPNHVVGGYSTNCTDCHTTNGWDDLTNFNHNITQFPLTGAHITTNCIDCHQQGYNNTPDQCIGCHQDDFNNTTDPNHQVSGFPTTCEDCHTTSAWTPATFNHNFYPISSQHNDVTCNECHSQPNYQPQCLSCHLEDFNEGHDPGDPTDCWGCHSTNNWDSNFSHANTNFQLTGAHLAISCQDCHSSGYQGTPTECFACHQTNYNNTTNPDHQALMLPTNCESCHTTNPGWQPATFPIHNQFFELLGAHLSVTNCDDCHDGNFNNTPNTCIGCHQNDYNGTNDPPHQILNFSTDCLECHNMSGWTPANFDHTFYPISSHHNNVDCNECHSQTNYQPQCLSCHLADFNEGHDPGDPTDCWGCHSTSNWDSNFDHNNTNFPLTGAHLAISCLDCHSGGYQGTPTECFACHQTNYNNTTNPDHEALMLPTDCETCHTTNASWQPATFPIHNQFFQLIGAHANITNCDDCHNGNYNNTSNTCIGCHQNDYNGTNDPPHQILSFSFDCLTCHTMNGWLPATFIHSFYPISNHHNNVDCNQCHSEANYQPQCLSCHYNDFLEGHNVGHSTDCWNCHNTSNWGDSPPPKSLIEVK